MNVESLGNMATSVFRENEGRVKEKGGAHELRRHAYPSLVFMPEDQIAKCVLRVGA